MRNQAKDLYFTVSFSNPDPPSARGVLKRTAAHNSRPGHGRAKNVEHDCGRPAKQEDAIHRRHWSKQSPSCGWRYVAVAECRIVYEGEVHPVGTGRRSTNNVIGQ